MYTSLQQLAKCFSNIISPQELLDIESKLLKLLDNFTDIRKKIKNIGKKAYLQVWSTQKDEQPLLLKLASEMEATQYSTASIKRLFSNIGNIVTVKRNRLNVENI